MNFEQLFFWIRLVAQVVLQVLEELDDRPEDGEVGPEMKPERIQFWIGVVARAVLYALDEAAIGPEMKPERIQFWLRIGYRFVVAIFEEVDEETGKSGERSGAPATVSQEAGW